MGCNYYAIKKADDELKTKICEAVNDNKFGLAMELMPKEIHIGKSSGGWQFIFNHHNWEYFQESLESLKEFLLSCDIFDEYNRAISSDAFWELVKNKSASMGDFEYGTLHFGLNFSNSTEFS